MKFIIISAIIVLSLLITGCISDKYEISVKEITSDSYNSNMRDKSNNIDVVKINIKNVQPDKKLSLAFETIGIVYDDGSQSGMLTGGSLFYPEIYFPSYCFSPASNREFFTSFDVLPNAVVEYNLCFNKIDWNKNPKLYLSMLSNVEVSFEGAGGDILTMNPVRKGDKNEYNILLDKNKYVGNKVITPTPLQTPTSKQTQQSYISYHVDTDPPGKGILYINNIKSDNTGKLPPGKYNFKLVVGSKSYETTTTLTEGSSELELIQPVE